MTSRPKCNRRVALALAVLYLAAALPAKTPKEIYDDNRRSVVMLFGFSGDSETDALGSGVMISETGDIATNLHVIRDAKALVAKLWNGSVLVVAGVWAFSEEMDLAILQTLGTELPAVTIASLATLSVGEEVVSIGNPLGLEGSLGTGVVLRITATGRTRGSVE